MQVSIRRYKVLASGKRKYLPIKIYTGISIKYSEWDNGKVATRANTRTGTKASPISLSINNKLDRLYDRALQIATEAQEKDWALIELKNALLSDKRMMEIIGRGNNDNSDIYEWMYDWIRKRADISFATSKQYIHSIKMMKEFDSYRGAATRWKDIDTSYYHEYVKWLKERGLKPNSIGSRIKNLLTLIRAADSSGIPVCQDYTKGTFKKPREVVESIYLTEEDLLRIEGINLSDNERLKNIRDWFLVGCNTGLRISDLMKLTEINISDRNIKITTQKTGAFVVIPITIQLKRVLDNRGWKLPTPISHVKYNMYIKEVAKLANLGDVTIRGERVPKWSLVSSHTARRTFATIMYQKGVKASELMLITGHKTESSFFKYIKTGEEENAKKLMDEHRDIFI